VNVISWSGHASHGTFPRPTCKNAFPAVSVMYITDSTPQRAHNPSWRQFIADMAPSGYRWTGRSAWPRSRAVFQYAEFGPDGREELS
jgi:hypothetical protein